MIPRIAALTNEFGLEAVSLDCCFEVRVLGSCLGFRLSYLGGSCPLRGKNLSGLSLRKIKAFWLRLPWYQQRLASDEDDQREKEVACRCLGTGAKERMAAMGAIGALALGFCQGPRGLGPILDLHHPVNPKPPWEFSLPLGPWLGGLQHFLV